METSENFDDVTLSENEIKILMDEALKQKKSNLMIEAYFRKVREAEKIPILTADQLSNWAIRKWQERYASKWIFTEENQRLINLFAQYFTQDPRFESENEGLSLKKGLLLYGGIGIGKTAIFQIFIRNQVASYRVVSCREIANGYSNNAAKGSKATDYLDDYIDEIDPTVNNPFKQDGWGICFDDLGTESSKKTFGNEVNVMEEILLSRYDRRNVLLNKTHITTNLKADEIEENYGPRVRSRMREMFNYIKFDSKEDMRK
jgi:hypothetical protein